MLWGVYHTLHLMVEALILAVFGIVLDRNSKLFETLFEKIPWLIECYIAISSCCVFQYTLARLSTTSAILYNLFFKSLQLYLFLSSDFLTFFGDSKLSATFQAPSLPPIFQIFLVVSVFHPPTFLLFSGIRGCRQFFKHQFKSTQIVVLSIQMTCPRRLSWICKSEPMCRMVSRMSWTEIFRVLVYHSEQVFRHADII